MIGAALGAAQTALGIGQTIAGLVKKKPEIPEYDIPQEVYANMTDAEYWAMEGLPDAQKQQYIQNIQRSGTTALSRSADRKGGLGLVSSIAQQEQDAATNLLSMDAQARMQNLSRLFQARETVAGYKDIKYDKDLAKVMEERAEVDELRGAGTQNIMNALGTFAALGDEDGEGGILGKLFGGEEGKIERQTKRADRRAARAERIADRRLAKTMGGLTWD